MLLRILISKTMKPTIFSVIFSLCMLSIPVLAATGTGNTGSLDMGNIKGLYFEGEFERVVEILEPYVKKRAEAMTREERIFAYKYLSVIFAAEEKTRNRAESYIYQLLRLAPTIELVDMYVSASVESFFRQVKSEFLKSEAYSRQYDEWGNPISKPDGNPNPAGSGSAGAKTPPQGASSSSPSAKAGGAPPAKAGGGIKKTKNRAWIGWALGGAAVAGGVALYLVLSQEEPGTEITGGL